MNSTEALAQALEALAAVEHEQWMAWASTIAMNESISPERLARWEKAMVPYADLPDDVKEQDREWVRKALAALPEGAALVTVESLTAALGEVIESEAVDWLTAAQDRDIAAALIEAVRR